MRTLLDSHLCRAGLLAAVAVLSTVAIVPSPSLAQAASGAPECGPANPTGIYEGWPIPGQVTANGNLLPLIISTHSVAGAPSRFLYSIADPTTPGVPTAAASVATQVSFYALDRDPATPVITVPGTFIDSGNGQGLYHAPVTFDCVGTWGLELQAALPAGTLGARVMFGVLPYGTTPAVGGAAPASETPTATTTEGIAAISTDQAPDPAFYRLSIAQAVASGKPTWIVFSTPAFCATATCGPTLDIVKGVAPEYADRVNFVHVEPYQLQMTDAGLQPLLSAEGQLQAVQSVIDYGLPTEPYQFLVDGSGIVRGAFQGIASADEVRAALESVLGPAG
jgi:hypothetical protein